MNRMLDPFYGISENGMELAKWLNRILLVAELAAGWKLAQYQLQYHPLGNWVWFVGIPLFLSAMGFVNSLLRQFWNIALTIYYGTTDPNEIAKAVNQSEMQAEQDRRRREQVRAIAAEQRRKSLPPTQTTKTPDIISYSGPRPVMNNKVIYYNKEI